MNATTKISYEEAVKQLADIVTRMENNEISIDELSSQLKYAQKLIKFCNDKLMKAASEIDTIIDDVK